MVLRLLVVVLALHLLALRWLLEQQWLVDNPDLGQQQTGQQGQGRTIDQHLRGCFRR